MAYWASVLLENHRHVLHQKSIEIKSLKVVVHKCDDISVWLTFTVLLGFAKERSDYERRWSVKSGLRQSVQWTMYHFSHYTYFLDLSYFSLILLPQQQRKRTSARSHTYKILIIRRYDIFIIFIVIIIPPLRYFPIISILLFLWPLCFQYCINNVQLNMLMMTRNRNKRILYQQIFFKAWLNRSK